MNKSLAGYKTVIILNPEEKYICMFHKSDVIAGHFTEICK